MGTELLDLESEHIEAVRQKKRPSVSEESRSRVAELARRAAAASAELPFPREPSDEAALEFLEALLSRYAAGARPACTTRRSAREIAGWVSFRLPDRSTFTTWSRPSGRTPLCRRSASAPSTGGGAARDSG